MYNLIIHIPFMLYPLDFSSWSDEWLKKVKSIKYAYPTSACPFQTDLSPKICHAWLEKNFVLTMRKLQV